MYSCVFICLTANKFWLLAKHNLFKWKGYDCNVPFLGLPLGFWWDAILVTFITYFYHFSYLTLICHYIHILVTLVSFHFSHLFFLELIFQIKYVGFYKELSYLVVEMKPKFSLVTQFHAKAQVFPHKN